MKMKRSFLIISLFIVSLNLYSQVEESVSPKKDEQKEKARFSERLVFGGDIGLSFGTITYIKLAPVIGYRLTSRLTAGLGPIYIYERYKNINFETSTYGGKAVASFTIFQGSEKSTFLGIGDVVFHVENEVVNVEPLYERNNGYVINYYFGNRLWIDNLLIGGGLMQSISGKFSISMFIMWDVTQNDFSPYTNPIFKFGFNF